MSSSIAKVPTCVTLPPDLLARVDRLAEADERSRSFVVAQALKSYCDAAEFHGAGFRPNAVEAARSAEGSSRPGGTPLSYPASLHVDAVQRISAIHDEREQINRENRARVMQENLESLKGLEFLNTTEAATRHAEVSKQLTDSWHRHAAVPTMAAQANARNTEAKAKSDALQRSAEYRRDLPVDG